MAEELGERTELPTGRRRSDARQQGQVARSTDLSASIDLIGAAILIAAFGGFGISGLVALFRRTFENEIPGNALRVEGIQPLLLQSFIDGVWVTAPILLVMFAVGCASHILQVGWHVTMEPLKPNISRINPASGFKKFVNLRNLVKTALSCIKLAVIGLVAAAVIRKHLPAIVALPQLTAMAAIYKVLSMGLELAIWLLVMFLAIGIADFVYQRWQTTQDLKMTKQEVKEERRSVDGDPDVKARRFRMARDIAMQRLGTTVPKADVIVTNPTHFSVAIKYDQDKMRAPRVIAKGADEMAFRIRQLAVASGIPMVERPPLARGLYWGIQVGQEIKPEFYEAVAEVLAYVYRLKGTGEKAA